MSAVGRPLGVFEARQFHGPSSVEKFASLRGCANVFYLGSKEVYQIEERGGKLVARSLGKQSVSLTSSIVKIALISTLVIPLIAVIGAFIYQSFNNIQVYNLEELKKGFEHSFRDCL